MHTASNKRDAPGIKTGTKAQRDAHGIKQTRCTWHQNWDQSPTRCTRHQTNVMHTASKTGTKAQRDAHGIKQTRRTRHQNWDQSPMRCTRHQTNAMHTASKLGPMPNAMHTASNKRDAHGIKQTRCIQHQITALKSIKNCHAPGHKIHGTNYAHNDAQAKQLVTSDTIQREPRPHAT